MGIVHSFVEESCWENEKLRLEPKQVIFNITTVGKIQGIRLDTEFMADYSIFFDPDDTFLLAILRNIEPDIAWGRLMFYPLNDHSAIHIILPSTSRIIGRIRVRNRTPVDTKEILSGDETWDSVVRMEDFRLARKKENAA